MHKQELLQTIERDRHQLVHFFSEFIRAKSPNPPGDTRDAVRVIRAFLDERGAPYEVVAPQEIMPNVLGTFECGQPGRNLVLNGHIDVFPAEERGWSCDPWSGVIENGVIYGRGSTDMKAGTCASLFAYAYLYPIRAHLKGRLTLTAVSDEETFGPWGTPYLLEHHEVTRGDCVLNGEPSDPSTIRFAEKGSVWLHFTVRTPGAHGAYTHKSASATKIACQLISELEKVTHIQPTPPEEVAKVLSQVEEATDRAQGIGAYIAVTNVTLNIGVIHGGLKVNMIPGTCSVEADVRLPVGVEAEQIQEFVEGILNKSPEITLESTEVHPPSHCDPNGEMVTIIQENVKMLRGFEPMPIVSLGGTDARLWRYIDIPAYVYGVSPSGMGSYDEHVVLDDFMHVVKTHAMSAYDYLSR